MDYYHNSKMAEEYDAIEVLLPDTKIVNTFLKTRIVMIRVFFMLHFLNFAF